MKSITREPFEEKCRNMRYTNLFDGQSEVKCNTCLEKLSLCDILCSYSPDEVFFLNFKRSSFKILSSELELSVQLKCRYASFCYESLPNHSLFFEPPESIFHRKIEFLKVQAQLNKNCSPEIIQLRGQGVVFQAKDCDYI